MFASFILFLITWFLYWLSYKMSTGQNVKRQNVKFDRNQKSKVDSGQNVNQNQTCGRPRIRPGQFHYWENINLAAKIMNLAARMN